MTPIFASLLFVIGVRGHPLTSRAGFIHSCAFARFLLVIGIRGHPLTSRTGFVNGRQMINFPAMDEAICILLSLFSIFWAYGSFQSYNYIQ